MSRWLSFHFDWVLGRILKSNRRLRLLFNNCSINLVIGMSLIHRSKILEIVIFWFVFTLLFFKILRNDRRYAFLIRNLLDNWQRFYIWVVRCYFIINSFILVNIIFIFMILLAIWESWLWIWAILLNGKIDCWFLLFS